MPQVSTSRTFAAAPQRVWDVLADYPNISSWNSGVKKSYSTSDATSGVGAERHCDLAPFGGLEETVRTWEEPRHLAISIDSASKLPIAHGLADFQLREIANGTTLDFTYDYEPKFGPVGKLMAPIVDRQLRKGFEGFMDDLEAAVTSAA